MNQKQITNIEVKKNNRNRIFRYICKYGAVSNPDISYATKLSLPTVTMLTKELIAEGLVEEIGELQSTGGRRAKALAVAANARQAAGLDITRHHIGLVLVNLAGEVIRYERIVLPYAETEDYYRSVNEKLEVFLDECSAVRERILGLGISFPGIIDWKEELVSDSHVLGVRSLGFDSVSRFFAYPCFFINDANAGAYAEGRRLDSSENFFYLSLSNTVGGALFGDGSLEQGKHFRCGEVGHMTVVPEGEMCYCGKKGCLDAYCSAKRLADFAGGRLENFFERLRQNDAASEKLWDDYTTYLAIAANNIHMILDCDIILGGYVGSCLEEYMQEIREKVSGRNTFEEDGGFVRCCHFRQGAAAQGAAFHVVDDFVARI